MAYAIHETFGAAFAAILFCGGAALAVSEQPATGSQSGARQPGEVSLPGKKKA
jgi:hypothetical protein